MEHLKLFSPVPSGHGGPPTVTIPSQAVAAAVAAAAAAASRPIAPAAPMPHAAAAARAGLSVTPSSPGSPDRHLCSSTNDGLGILQGGINLEVDSKNEKDLFASIPTGPVADQGRGRVPQASVPRVRRRGLRYVEVELVVILK